MKFEDSGTPRSRAIGLFAILTLWLSAAVSLPYANLLQGHFSTEGLLVLRSLSCLAVIISIGRIGAWRTTNEIAFAGFIIAFSSLTFYWSLESLGVNATAVLVTLTPIVNLVIAMIEGKRPSWAAMLSLAALIAGTAWALEIWSQPLPPEGLIQMFACMVASGIGFHYWGKAPDTVTVSEKCFWLCAATIIESLLVAWAFDMDLNLGKYAEPAFRKPLLRYAIPVTLFIFVSIIPYSRVGKMNTVLACALSQAGMPFTIMGAALFADEHLKAHQWPGVFLALFGATALSVQTLLAKPAARPG